MNLKEQFEKEIDKIAMCVYLNNNYYSDDYVKWLENKLDEKNNIGKVYVVTSGRYSDYGIDHIFLNEEDADKYVEEKNKGDYNQFCVELYNLNKTNIKTRECWQLDVYSKEPIFKRIEHYVEDAVEENKKSEINKYDWCWEKNYEPTEYIKKNGELIGKVHSYVSEDHCKKLAVELYQEFLRKDVYYD